MTSKGSLQCKAFYYSMTLLISLFDFYIRKVSLTHSVSPRHSMDTSLYTNYYFLIILSYEGLVYISIILL